MNTNAKRFPTLSQMTAISALVTAVAPTVINKLTALNFHVPAMVYVVLVGIGVNCRSLNSTNSGLDQAEAEAATQIPPRYLALMEAIANILRKGVIIMDLITLKAKSTQLVQAATDARTRAATAQAQGVDLTTVGDDIDQTAAILATIAPAPVTQQSAADTPAEAAAEQPVQ